MFDNVEQGAPGFTPSKQPLIVSRCLHSLPFNGSGTPLRQGDNQGPLLILGAWDPSSVGIKNVIAQVISKYTPLN